MSQTTYTLYGWAPDGGLWLLDPDNRRASYSYPSSENAERAARGCVSAVAISAQTIARQTEGMIPASIYAEHYARAMSAGVAWHRSS